MLQCVAASWDAVWNHLMDEPALMLSFQKGELASCADWDALGRSIVLSARLLVDGICRAFESDDRPSEVGGDDLD